jgi:hypothetical protein
MNKDKYLKNSKALLNELQNLSNKDEIKLIEIAKFCNISKSRVSQLFTKCKDVQFSTLLYLSDSMNYDLIVTFKKRTSKNQTQLEFKKTETTIKTTEI